MANYTRRTVLQATGASLAVTVAAGCLSDAGGDEFEIDPETAIVIEGYDSHWDGIAPEKIDGAENPTFVLTADETYTIEWINGDGMNHDLQLWDDSGDVVEELATDSISTQGDEASLEFTATDALAEYVCTYHSRRQIGELVVE